MEHESYNGPSSALRVPAIKTPTFDDDGLAPQCSDDEDLGDFTKVSIADNVQNAHELDPMTHRFYGKSSGVELIQTAIDLKNEFSGLPLDKHPRPLKPLICLKRAEYWNVRPVGVHPFGNPLELLSHLIL